MSEIGSDTPHRRSVAQRRNRAGGSLGAERVARSAADGYTLLMGHTGTLAVNPWLYPKLGYDAQKSFAPVAWVARVPNELVVHAAAYPVQGDCAVGDGPAWRTGPDPVHRRTRTAAAYQVRQDARDRGVEHEAHDTVLPEVPTVAESGVPGTAGFEADQWYGLVAPAGTPANIVALLNQHVNKALESNEVRTRLASEGAEATPSTPQAFAQLIASDLIRWEKVVKTAGVKAE